MFYILYTQCHCFFREYIKQQCMMKMMYAPYNSKVSVYRCIFNDYICTISHMLYSSAPIYYNHYCIMRRSIHQLLLSMSPSYIDWNSRHPYFTIRTKTQSINVTQFFLLILTKLLILLRGDAYSDDMQKYRLSGVIQKF